MVDLVWGYVPYMMIDFIDKSLLIQLLYLAGVVSLILLGGVFSGIMLRLMELDKTFLITLQRSGTIEEKSYTSQILPVKRKSYLLLCTLLVANAIGDETLPLLVDRLCGKGWAAILIPTVLRLLFAEY